MHNLTASRDRDSVIQTIKMALMNLGAIDRGTAEINNVVAVQGLIRQIRETALKYLWWKLNYPEQFDLSVQEFKNAPADFKAAYLGVVQAYSTWWPKLAQAVDGGLLTITYSRGQNDDIVPSSPNAGQLRAALAGQELTDLIAALSAAGGMVETPEVVDESILDAL